MRRKTKEVKVGDIGIGGDNPIRVQSMTSTRTIDIDQTIEQIHELVKEDCEIVRVSIPDERSLKAFREIRKSVSIPLVADIHYNHQLAIKALEYGADKIRINPGNMGSEKKLKEIAAALRLNKKPVRIGVNAGSLEKDLVEEYNKPIADALVRSALKWVDFFQNEKVEDIVISVKSSSVIDTIRAYQLLSERTNYPLHIGVTESGTLIPGTVKSSIAIGVLLLNGIGDTIRVSLTDDPVKEVKVAWEILKSLELRYNGPQIISCPTCARTRVNLLELVNKIERATQDIKKPIKIAVMGCEVNGPGEARNADVGVAAEPGKGLIFVRGKPIKRVPEQDIVEEILKLINTL